MTPFQQQLLDAFEKAIPSIDPNTEDPTLVGGIAVALCFFPEGRSSLETLYPLLAQRLSRPGEQFLAEDIKQAIEAASGRIDHGAVEREASKINDRVKKRMQ